VAAASSEIETQAYQARPFKARDYLELLSGGNNFRRDRFLEEDEHRGHLLIVRQPKPDLPSPQNLVTFRGAEEDKVV